ncbi:Thiosulfate:glutathione sulfurtransferase [Halocaridina rubra]|uniref:Thiosulfate:glutathione sulfurtransferase n=1 Tax=Halocaridina rubra TaxID=373956 RepID=A0AAN8XNH6_HALRR
MSMFRFLPTVVSATSRYAFKTNVVRAFPKFSTNVSLPPDIEFDELKKKVETQEITLIDVRTSGELANVGMIPTSKHFHVYYVGPDILLPDDEFEKKVGFKKPGLDDPLVITCLLGIRARTAQMALMTAGYKNVRVYKGSFTDWSERGGPIVFPEPAKEG